MTQAGRAFIGLHPEIAEIKVVSEDSEGGLLHTFWIHSEERQWEIDRAAERYHREQEEREALRRARGEPPPPPFDPDNIQF